MELGVGLVRVSRKGCPSVPGNSMVIYGIEVLLKFFDLIFPRALWRSSTYLSHHLINVGDVGMAKNSVFLIDICNDRGDR